MPRRVLHDTYFKRAKAEGYLARSAYKLDQIQQAKKIIRPGDRVLDLGCAPGAWLQVAASLVGPRGEVIGIDLQPVKAAMPPNVATAVGDVYELEPESLPTTSNNGRGRFNVVLSDMAPNTTGINDHEMSIRLCERVLELVPKLIAPGGNLAMKVFEGSQYPELLKRIGRDFAKVKGFKPDASRDVSREMYIVATGYHGAIV